MKKESGNVTKANALTNIHNLRISITQDLFRIMFLMFTSLVLGIIVNSIHPMGLPIRLSKVKTPGIPTWVWNQLHITDAQTAFEEVSAGQGLLVDVRDRKDYQKGYAQGAINLPYHEFEEYYPAFAKRVSKEEHLFIYCYGSIECVLSSRVAKRLLVYGFKNLTTIKQGFAAWKKSNLPIDKKSQDMK